MHIEWIAMSDFRSYRCALLFAVPDAQRPDRPQRPGQDQPPRSARTPPRRTVLPRRQGRRSRALGRAAARRVSGEIGAADVTREIRRDVAPREDGGWVVTGEGCPWARAIPFGWQDLAILTGGPQARRNFLDGFAAKLFPAHRGGAGRYRQVLDRRNHLLQPGWRPRSSTRPSSPGTSSSRAWGSRSSDGAGRRWTSWRREVRALYPEMAGDGEVALGYRGSLPEGVDEGGVRGRRCGSAAATSCVGARRSSGPTGTISSSSWTGATCGSSARAASSASSPWRCAWPRRGRWRARSGSSPVLLLDDALSELDPAVQGDVLRHVEGAGQVFLTTAEDDAARRDARPGGRCATARLRTRSAGRSPSRESA